MRAGLPTGPPAQGSAMFGKLSALPRNKSAMLGARKAVEYVPRTVTSRIGAYRPPNL